MNQNNIELLNEHSTYSLRELCELCDLHAEGIIEMAEFGIIDPIGNTPQTWHFSGITVIKIKKAIRLQNDLDINLSGIALSLDLLEEIHELRYEVQELQNRLKTIEK
jgi:chaperone modulatory protein CbpM